MKDLEDHPCSYACRECGQCDHHGQDLSHLFHTRNYKNWLCHSCAKQQKLECIVEVCYGFGSRFSFKETCEQCQSPLLVYDENPTPLSCLPPFDYYWTIAVTSHVGSDFFLVKRLGHVLFPKDLWLLIHQYCFPFQGTKKTLYVHKRESNRILFAGGLFPNSRRAVIYVRGIDTAGQEYGTYFRYRSIGPTILEQFQESTVCCE